jgi:hypothetical protein
LEEKQTSRTWPRTRNRHGRRSRRGRGWRRGDDDVGADGADFAAADKDSIQLIRGTTREATMDFGRILLAISQVAAANEILFDKVESAPMARFHSIGQVFPDALYGHIIVTFDMAALRAQIKDLQ